MPRTGRTGPPGRRRGVPPRHPLARGRRTAGAPVAIVARDGSGTASWAPREASRYRGSVPSPTPSLRLRPYADADRWLTESIETSPVMMADLGGPLPADDIPGIHARRLAGMAADRLWYFTVELA